LSDILSRWIFFNLLQESVLVGEQTPPLESSRPRGVQFPFAVGDRVLIKVSTVVPHWQPCHHSVCYTIVQ
jgi:hypothetical protein